MSIIHITMDLVNPLLKHSIDAFLILKYDLYKITMKYIMISGVSWIIGYMYVA